MVRQRTDKRLLWDGRTRMLLACASIPVMIETAYLYGIGDGGDATLLFMLLSVIGSLLMALFPRIGGWAIVALWTARCVVPETTPFSMLFCLLMAITIMAYLNIGMSLLAAVVAEAATAARIWLYPWDSSVFAIVCATAAFLMVALWLGSMMSWRERQEIEDQEHAELVRRIADQQLATQLHHSVANDLTTILLLSRQLRSDTGHYDHHSTDDHDTVTLIERTAQESLAKVRTLIAGLDQDGSRVTGQSAVFRDVGTDRSRHPMPARVLTVTADELHTVAESYDARLHANGLDGAIIISGEASCSCTADRKDAMLDILREIIGNTMKYADPTAGYCVAITLAPGLATMSASNGVRRPAAGGEIASGIAQTTVPADTAVNAHDGNVSPRASDALSGGTGIDRCRRIVTALGGEFTVEHDDSSWTTLVTLPLA
ncbi:hypothetical protein [Bifidobacterium sp. SO1]|uniref:hypothetical protein n=1 Tax=Bifidobacterium sp. SO1 TaxID=2809029 RepID=UPI001BDDAFDF|nr:hypothetical protein [Bifidobacterium sp. SO1]MBT1160293.1 hypothetical protein [Bifidobacterium sp. SO1]